ncbi:MAG: bifunctional UDP-sugar hydrolase/5'-nucleotidase [Myxococcota bacterium]
MRTLCLLTLIASTACKRAPNAAPEPVVEVPSKCGIQPDGTRTFRVLHINDVYRIEGLADGRGGLDRVRTLRAHLEADCPGAVLLTHAGDALYPSLISQKRNGEQMVAVLNLMDGSSELADPLMFATFGNHEFDKYKLKYSPILQSRIGESQFTWLDTNIAWAEGENGPLISGSNLKDEALLEVGGVKVGLFSISTNAVTPAYAAHIDTDYAGVARTRVADLREQGAEYVIALTHLDATQDMSVLQDLGDSAPDLILGGHDHSLFSAELDGRAILKGDADATRVRTVEVSVGPSGAVSWTADTTGVPLNPNTHAGDPAVRAEIDAQIASFTAEFCEGKSPTCLSEELTIAGTDWVAEETTIRRFETNVGNLAADLMVDSFPDANIAFINSGALRLNQNIPKNTPITRQIVEELLIYGGEMHHVQVSGATLRAVLERSVQDWTGQGHWLQVSGIAFEHAPDTNGVGRVVVLTPDGPVALDPKTMYDVVTVRFLLDKSMGNQDGYTMLSMDQVVEDPNNGKTLKDKVFAALEAAGSSGVGPVVDGRICNVGQSDRCQVPAE